MTKVTFECTELEVESQCNAFVCWELENLQQPVVYSMEKKIKNNKTKKTRRRIYVCWLIEMTVTASKM